MKNSSLILLAAILVLPACTGLGIATGVGASAGVAAAQEGGIGGAVTDTRIRLQINELWFRHDVDMFRKVGLTVNQGRVLLTGTVQNPEHRVEAVRLAWQPEGVKQVINEIRVADSDGITGFARDAWITTRLRTQITFEKNVLSINYSIDTVSGIVYLMGVARSQQELNKVIQIARTIPDVKQVVSYVKLLGQQIGEPAPASYNDTSYESSSPPPANDYNYAPPADTGYHDAYPPAGSSYEGGGYAQPDYEKPGYHGIEAEPLPLVPQP